MGEVEEIVVRSESDCWYAQNRAKILAKGVSGEKAFEEESRIIADELANNLIFHGGGGTIFIKTDENRIELESINDNFKNLFPNSIDDGFSTKDRLGKGLATLQRLSNRLDIIYENKLKIRAIKFLNSGLPKFVTCIISFPGTGKSEENGDGYMILHAPNKIIFVLADILGHGKGAYKTKSELIDYVNKFDIKNNISDLFYNLHSNMRGTRGAEISLASYEPVSKDVKFNFIGIGNIESRFLQGGVEYLRSIPGILGDGMPKISIENRVAQKCTLVLYTDGISSMVDLSKLIDEHPLKIAHKIMENRKGKDDATVVVTKTQHLWK